MIVVYIEVDIERILSLLNVGKGKKSAIVIYYHRHKLHYLPLVVVHVAVQDSNRLLSTGRHSG